MNRIAALCGLALALPLQGAFAHPLAPGLLELTQVAPTRYAVLWRTPVARTGVIAVEPRLPDGCVAVAPPDVQPGSAEVLTARWLAECARGLEGQTLVVDGLPGSGINVIVRVVSADGAAFKALLGADQPAATVSFAAPGVFTRYLALGAEHLMTGLDHVLFVIGLFLLVPGLRALAITVTAFTAGHSVTLSLAALGIVPLGPGPAELLIAATVLALGVELARGGAGRASWLRRRPWRMAALFGLIHGLGFAGALRDVGLPLHDVPLALLAFNVGIELAQLALIAVLALAAAVLRAVPAPRLAQALPAYVIGSLAACWLLERAVGLLA